MKKETKFNYGLLFVGLALPIIAEYFLGRAWGVIVAIVLGVIGAILMASGHTHREEGESVSRRRKTAAFVVIGAVVALALMGIRAVYAHEFGPNHSPEQANATQSSPPASQQQSPPQSSPPQAATPPKPKKKLPAKGQTQTNTGSTGKNTQQQQENLGGTNSQQQSSGSDSPNVSCPGGVCAGHDVNGPVIVNPPVKPLIRSMVVSVYLECHLREGYKKPESFRLTTFDNLGALFQGLGHPAALQSSGTVAQFGSKGELITYQQDFNHDDTGGLIGLPVEELSKITTLTVAPSSGIFGSWCSQVDKGQVAIVVNDQFLVGMDATPPGGEVIPEFRDAEKRHPAGLPSLTFNNFTIPPDALAKIK